MFIVSLNPTSVDVNSIVMGNILGIADDDLWQVVLIIAISLLGLILFWKDLLLVFFDEHHALSVGLSPLRYKVIFFTLLSACVVVALQTVGQFWLLRWSSRREQLLIYLPTVSLD